MQIDGFYLLPFILVLMYTEMFSALEVKLEGTTYCSKFGIYITQTKMGMPTCFLIKLSQ